MANWNSEWVYIDAARQVRMIFSWKINSCSYKNKTYDIDWEIELTTSPSGSIPATESRALRVTIDGKQEVFSVNLKMATNSNKVLASGTRTITNNFNINKEVRYNIFLQIDATICNKYNGQVDWSYYFDLAPLDNIPYIVSVTSAVTDEQNFKLVYNVPSQSIVTKLQSCVSLTGKYADLPYRDVSKSSTEYVYNLSEAERNMLRAGITGTTSSTIRVYLTGTLENGETFNTYKTIKYNIVACSPLLSPELINITEGNIADIVGEDVLLKGYSKVQFAVNAEPRKQAQIVSQKVVNGSQTVYGDTGVINKVNSGEFVFTVTDNRQLSKSYTITKPIVNYIALTCNLKGKNPTAEGNLALQISGNYFEGELGKTTNNLTVQYRYQPEGGEYIDWVTVEGVSISDNKYNVEFVATGLDYTKKYLVQARAVDVITTVETKAYAVKSIPVFDWGEDDFNFNVPVNFNAPINFKNNRVMGVGTSGENYQVQIGANYGILMRPNGLESDVGQFKLETTGNIKHSDTYNGYYLTNLCDAFHYTWSLPTVVTDGSDYDGCICYATLRGSNLHLQLHIYRDEVVKTVGNIDETTMSVRVIHNGKLRGAGSATFTSYNGSSTFFITNINTTDTDMTFDVVMKNVIVANYSTWRGRVSVPVTINLTNKDAFDYLVYTDNLVSFRYSNGIRYLKFGVKEYPVAKNAPYDRISSSDYDVGTEMTYIVFNGEIVYYQW